MTAAWSPSAAPAVRFGATVGKRNARRAIDRALVKRILREAGRHAAPALEAACAQRGLQLDIAFRLKTRRDRSNAGEAVAVTLWRRAVRDEADALLEHLGRHISGLDG